MESLNRTLFLAINAPVGTPHWEIAIAIVLASYLIYAVPLLLIIVWLWGNSHHRNLAIKAFLVVVLGLGINYIIGLAWYHPRPFMAGIGHIFIHHPADSSFPSDHMTVFMGMAITLLLSRAEKLGLVTLLAAIGVAWARVFLGVHFPFDMLGAVVVAAIAYLVVVMPWRKYGHHITQLAEGIYRKIFAAPIALGWIHD